VRRTLQISPVARSAQHIKIILDRCPTIGWSTAQLGITSASIGLVAHCPPQAVWRGVVMAAPFGSNGRVMHPPEHLIVLRQLSSQLNAPLYPSSGYY
jgi:hypothetical protein